MHLSHQFYFGKCHVSIFSSGNPIESREVRLAKTNMRNFAKKSGHQVKQRDAFLPLDMLGINGLVAARKFNKNDFMFLLMFMQSYTLANRCTGLINSRMFDFNRFMWASSTHSIKYGIQSVTKEVFKKTEKKPTLYNIEWQDDFPKLCWMRHLFIYINCHRYKANIDPSPPDGYKVDPSDGSPILPPYDLDDEKLFLVPLSDIPRKEIEDTPVEFYSNDLPEDTSIKKQILISRNIRIEKRLKSYT
jgi:hypothetical protein